MVRFAVERAPAQAVRMALRLLTCCAALAVWFAMAGCGDDSGGPNGGGGAGGAPLQQRTTFDLECTIDELTLQVPIALEYTLDRPLMETDTSTLTTRAAVTLDETAATSLIDADVPTIDIVAVRVRGSVTGASPTRIENALPDVPINDFDLRSDPNDDGTPGPHVLMLDDAVVNLRPDTGATEVTLGLDLTGIDWRLGDVRIPDDCIQPTLAGFSSVFPVSSN